CPELALLHPVAGAAAVEVDRLVTVGLADPGATRQRRRVAAADLQGHPVPLVASAEQALTVAMDDRLRGNDLGVEPRVARQRPVKGAAMTIGPVHHRRNR